MAWRPPERGPWVEKLATFGRGLGDDGKSLVSLRADDLLAASRSATGLHEAGDDWFREPLQRLCAALDEEAELHLAGRVRARAELQLILQNRLRLIDLGVGAHHRGRSRGRPDRGQRARQVRHHPPPRAPGLRRVQ